jgi:hypothetical protein
LVCRGPQFTTTPPEQILCQWAQLSNQTTRETKCKQLYQFALAMLFLSTVSFKTK